MQSVGIMAAAVLLAAMAGAGQPGSAQKGAPAHRRPAAGKPVEARPPASDAQIEASIRARFAKSKINADRFQVRVQGGVATLEGRTDVIQHKGTATRLAKTGGAVAVKNHIQVSDAARQKAAANLEKGRRRAQIRRGEARSEDTTPRKSR